MVLLLHYINLCVSVRACVRACVRVCINQYTYTFYLCIFFCLIKNIIIKFNKKILMLVRTAMVVNLMWDRLLRRVVVRFLEGLFKKGHPIKNRKRLMFDVRALDLDRVMYVFLQIVLFITILKTSCVHLNN